MTPDEIRQLVQQADDLYQAGDYQQAKDVWKRVLDADPGNERAEEGIRMAGLLSDNWDFFAEEGGEDDAAVRAALNQVATLAGEGNHHDALAMLQDLAQTYPDNGEIRRVGQEVAQAYEAAPFIAEHLTEAQVARGEGRDDDAAAACRKILALDPAHRAARSLLEEIEFGVGNAPSAPDGPSEAEAGASVAGPPAETPDMSIESDVDAALAAAVPSMEAAPANPGPAPRETSGSLSPSGDVSSAGSHTEPPPPPPAMDDELPMLDLVEASDEDEAPADLAATPAPPAAPDLDLDIDFDMTDEPPAADPDAPQDIGAPMDAGAPGADAVPDAEDNVRRVSQLVEDGHRALDESRHSEAIDFLSRALAIDQSHEGAATLLEKARCAQAEAHDLAEAKVFEANDLIDAGRLDEAEALAGHVLAQIPDHQIAEELIERIAALKSAPPTPAEEAAAPVVSAEDQLDGLAAEEHESVPLGSAQAADPSAHGPADMPDMPDAGAMPAPPAARERISDTPARVKRKPRGALIAALVIVVALGAAGVVFRERLLALVGYGVAPVASAASAEPVAAEPAPPPAETDPVEAEPAPEPIQGTAPAPVEDPPNTPQFQALLDQAREHLRAGRGNEAMASLQAAEELMPDNKQVRAMRPPVRWTISARQAFDAADFAGSLRSLYRLSYEADRQTRPRQIGRWLDNARWNYLLQSLQEAEPYTAIDRAKRELQVRGEERARLEPLLNVARKWMYENPAGLRGEAYRADVAAFSMRELDG